MDFPPVVGDEIVRVARTYLGTPWHHDARLKGVGIDCSGLLIGTLQECGVPVEDVRGYGRGGDDFEAMLANVRRYARKVHARMPGDILLFRGRMMLNHCGFWTGEGLIHAYSAPAVMAVAEHPLDESWERRIVGHYRYKGNRGAR